MCRGTIEIAIAILKRMIVFAYHALDTLWGYTGASLVLVALIGDLVNYKSC